MVDRRRQWRAENQEILIEKHIIDNRYAVRGSSNDIYTVDLDKPFCTCPDWEKREPLDGCKHILKVKLKEGTIDPLPSTQTNFGSDREGEKRNYPDDWESLSQRVKKRDNWECQNCGKAGGSKGIAELHAHHIYPKSQGGEDRLQNLITLCLDCHEDEHGHPIPSAKDSNNRKRQEDIDIGSVENQSEGSTSGGNAQTGNNLSGRESNLDEELLEEYIQADTGPINYSDHQPNTTSGNVSTETQCRGNSKQAEKNKSITASSSSKLENQPSSDDNQSVEIDEEEELEDLGIVTGIVTYLFLTVLFSIILPPFFEVTDWKMGMSSLFVGLLFVIELSHADSLYREVRGLIGLFIFSGAGITTLLGLL